jgi:hypothetical protein
MTLSNFDWTDKESVKWFVLLPTGHEGPYSLKALQSKKLSRDVQVWAEGLDSPLKLSQAVTNAAEKPKRLVEIEDDIPPLPPLPEETEPQDLSTPPIPTDETPELSPATSPVKRLKIWAGAAAISLGVITLLLTQWVSSQKQIKLTRMSRMSPELHQRISNAVSFEGWDKRIFFKEFVSADLTNIWFVTSGFQRCDVEASFKAIQGKLLTLNEEKIFFKSRSLLKGHVAEFSKFEFMDGNKIIPGLYEAEIRASNCEWDGITPAIGNGFSAPDAEYFSRMKVVLYPAGAVEFNVVLDKLLKKKIDAALKVQSENELFWEDLQLKFQTLHMITLQIEQLFMDLLEKDESGFLKGVKFTVDQYTKNFGHFLTQFVIANDEYFKDLAKSGSRNIAKKQTYEPVVRVTAKQIGLESMKIIEDFQKQKKFSPQELKEKKAEVLKTFEKLKATINNQIIRVTEDRSDQNG